MTTTERVFRKETLTPLGAPFKGKLKLKPSWTQYESEYTVNHDAEGADLDAIDPEQAHTFTFVRERQKNNTNGSQDFHYYWGIWAITEPSDEPQEAPQDVAVGTSATGADPLVTLPMDTGTLIIDQVITKIAAELRVAYSDETYEWAAEEAVRLWNAVRYFRHQAPTPASESPVQEAE